ncbi:hypothetical protein PINS_up008701 [Pythium insidiosum]|nr:hypothetical protein PINS_up008701 [Pythium insidiosum]
MPPKAGAKKAPSLDAPTLQKQLLELVQSKGNAVAATDAFLRLATLNMDDVLVGSMKSASTSGTKVQVRRSTPEQHQSRVLDALLCQYSASSDYWRRKEQAGALAHGPSEASHAAKKQKEVTRESMRQWALVAAKAAQSLVKTYASSTASDAAETQDLGCAVDLAVMALRVVFRHSSIARLGECVAENLLYQVAKKATEIPKNKVRAVTLLVALHIQLWQMRNELNAKIDSASTQRVSAPPLVDHAASALEKGKPCELHVLVSCLGEFPAPTVANGLQFTRLLVSAVSVVINVLLPSGQTQHVLRISESIMKPWIKHLETIPGVDAKLGVSFCDRVFRVLWKCAAMVEADPSKIDEDSLRYRSLALSFMLQCPSYTTSYCIQQVHRSGVQHEKRRKEWRGLAQFYAQCFDHLSTIRKGYTKPQPRERLFVSPQSLAYCDGNSMVSVIRSMLPP